MTVAIFSTTDCTDDCVDICAEDLNNDEMVNGVDLAYILGYWGTDDPLGDVNLDGNVDAADLGLVLAAWGPCMN